MHGYSLRTHTELGDRARRLNYMRLLSLLVAAILTSTPAAGHAQLRTPSSSPSESTPAPAPEGTSPVLPVSIDHIRDALSRPTDSSLLRITELPVDFRITIVEQRKIDEMLSKLDFKGGPVPAGGLYAFEQQQRLFRPTDRPLMQPYAAYNGGQFMTIALENLLGKYLGGPLVNAVAGAARMHAEREAREEVDRAIADYCAARSDRAQIQLCSSPDP
jgi:hypothetical protein